MAKRRQSAPVPRIEEGAGHGTPERTAAAGALATAPQWPRSLGTADAERGAVIAGLSAKTVDGAGAFSYPIVFLPFISSAFVPTHTMPGPVRAFADNQPVTSIVNTIRDLFAQQPVSTGIWAALAWCVGILIVACTLAMATYRRTIS
jgi:hypothetical protein